MHFNFAQIYYGETVEFGTPQTVAEALSGPEAVQWKEAMGNEAVNFISRKSWRKVLKIASEVVTSKNYESKDNIQKETRT